MRLLLSALLAAAALCDSGLAFMYRPATGLTWDPSCMTWEGKTYCYFMCKCSRSLWSSFGTKK